eukprot:g1477.t1
MPASDAGLCVAYQTHLGVEIAKITKWAHVVAAFETAERRNNLGLFNASNWKDFPKKHGVQMRWRRAHDNRAASSATAEELRKYTLDELEDRFQLRHTYVNDEGLLPAQPKKMQPLLAPLGITSSEEETMAQNWENSSLAKLPERNNLKKQFAEMMAEGAEKLEEWMKADDPLRYLRYLLGASRGTTMKKVDFVHKMFGSLGVTVKTMRSRRLGTEDFKSDAQYASDEVDLDAVLDELERCGCGIDYDVDEFDFDFPEDHEGTDGLPLLDDFDYYDEFFDPSSLPAEDLRWVWVVNQEDDLLGDQNAAAGEWKQMPVRRKKLSSPPPSAPDNQLGVPQLQEIYNDNIGASGNLNSLDLDLDMGPGLAGTDLENVSKAPKQPVAEELDLDPVTGLPPAADDVNRRVSNAVDQPIAKRRCVGAGASSSSSAFVAGASSSSSSTAGSLQQYSLSNISQAPKMSGLLQRLLARAPKLSDEVEDKEAFVKRLFRQAPTTEAGKYQNELSKRIIGNTQFYVMRSDKSTQEVRDTTKAVDRAVQREIRMWRNLAEREEFRFAGLLDDRNREKVLAITGDFFPAWRHSSLKRPVVMKLRTAGTLNTTLPKIKTPECREEAQKLWDDYTRYSTAGEHTEPFVFLEFYLNAYTCMQHQYHLTNGTIAATANVLYDSLRYLKKDEAENAEVEKRTATLLTLVRHTAKSVALWCIAPKKDPVTGKSTSTIRTPVPDYLSHRWTSLLATLEPLHVQRVQVKMEVMDIDQAKRKEENRATVKDAQFAVTSPIFWGVVNGLRAAIEPANEKHLHLNRYSALLRSDLKNDQVGAIAPMATPLSKLLGYIEKHLLLVHEPVARQSGALLLLVALVSMVEREAQYWCFPCLYNQFMKPEVRHDVPPEQARSFGRTVAAALAAVDPDFGNDEFIKTTIALEPSMPYPEWERRDTEVKEKFDLRYTAAKKRSLDEDELENGSKGKLQGTFDRAWRLAEIYCIKEGIKDMSNKTAEDRFEIPPSVRARFPVPPEMKIKLGEAVKGLDQVYPGCVIKRTGADVDSPDGGQWLALTTTQGAGSSARRRGCLVLLRQYMPSGVNGNVWRGQYRIDFQNIKSLSNWALHPPNTDARVKTMKFEVNNDSPIIWIAGPIGRSGYPGVKLWDGGGFKKYSAPYAGLVVSRSQAKDEEEEAKERGEQATGYTRTEKSPEEKWSSGAYKLDVIAPERKLMKEVSTLYIAGHWTPTR